MVTTIYQFDKPLLSFYTGDDPIHFFNNMIKKLKRMEVEEKLKKLGLIVFTPQEFRNIFGVAQPSASVFLSHNAGQGGIFVKLRNGLYLIKDARVSPFFMA